MRIVQNNHFQKSANELLILRELRKGPLSRVRLASLLGLRQSTVTYCTSRLAEAGLVRLTGDKISYIKGAGRKQELLEINSDAGRVIGLEMLMGSYRMSICDILGNLIASDAGSYDDMESLFSDGSHPSAVEVFKTRVSALAASALALCGGVPVWGMGIAVPGIVSFDGKTIVSCWTHGLRDCDLSDFLATFPFPIVMENDANCCALKYVIHGSSVEDDTFLYVRFQSYDGLPVPPGIPSVGIGLGLVLDGRLYRGYRSRAGEFRSAYAGAVIGTTQLSFSHEQLLMRHQNPAIMKEIIGELLDNLLSIRTLLDPRKMYLGGFDEEERTALSAGIRLFLDSDETAGFRESCVIVSNAEEDACLGAASLVVDEVFRMPVLGERKVTNEINWLSRTMGVS